MEIKMSKYTYTDEMKARLDEVGRAGPITEQSLESLCEEFGYPRRSVAAMLRKMEFEVPKKTTESVFSEDETESFRSYLESNSGNQTAVEIAESFAGGKFTPGQIRGKALALKMTEHIKKAEKKAAVRTYTPEEEDTIRGMVDGGSYLEDIAEKLGKTVNSVRGKLLSMKLTAPQKNKKATTGSYEGIEDNLNMSVAELAEKYGKTERGVKTVLSRRKLSCADYTPKSASSDE